MISRFSTTDLSVSRLYHLSTVKAAASLTSCSVIISVSGDVHTKCFIIDSSGSSLVRTVDSSRYEDDGDVGAEVVDGGTLGEV